MSKVIVQNFVQLSKRSKHDKIATFNAKDLGIKAPKFSAWKVSFAGGIDIVFYSNRANSTSLTVAQNKLPRAIKLPKVGKPSSAFVMTVERLY